MTAGRPKEYDRIKIGHDLVEWARNNPLALTIPMFATSIGMNSSILRKWCNENEEFRSLYMQAKELVGINRFNCTQEGSGFKIDNTLHTKTMHHYDYDILEDIHQEKIFESNLRRQEEGVKQTNITLQVPHGLAIGSNIPTSTVSNESNPGS